MTAPRKKTFRTPKLASHVELRLSINALMEEQAVLTNKATSILQMLMKSPYSNTEEARAITTAVIQDMEAVSQTIKLLREKVLNG